MRLEPHARMVCALLGCGEAEHFTRTKTSLRWTLLIIYHLWKQIRKDGTGLIGDKLGDAYESATDKVRRFR